MNARGISGAVAISLHVAVFGALLSYEPARTALASAAPIMVSLITAQRAEPVVEIPAPKPTPVVKRKPPEPMVVASPTPAALEITAPPLPPEPAPAPAALPREIAATAAAPIEVVTAPIFNADYLDNPSPPYPLAARRSGQQGRVTLRVLVSVSGTADEVQIRASSGFVRLDEAARDTVQRWRFVPARRGAQPVPAWVLIPVTFGLERS